MGLWNAYFLAKLYFYHEGYIRLDVLLNLVFAAFILAPAPGRLRNNRAVAAARLVLGIFLAALLLWHDSWLRPPVEAFEFLRSQGMPSGGYIASFLLGYFNLRDAAAVALIVSIAFAAKRFKVSIGPVVILLLVLVIPAEWKGQGDSKSLGNMLDAFYGREAGRVVDFDGKRRPDFDVAVIHVCSLSWKDFKDAGVDGKEFFRRFDYLFTAFNSATTYSGPAAIRLMRANCGQERHAALYNEAPEDCYLFDKLAQMGFRVDFALNHNGVYGGFAKEAQSLGHMRAPLQSQDGLRPAYLMFDGSPVYDDYAVLGKWWRMRLSEGPGPVALYYNTVTLHDGIHRQGEKNWWAKDKTSEYRTRLAGLLGGLTRFMGLLESSGRNVVVVFVPEHGAALGGSRIQAPGLRDMPLPDITLVPVGVKLIGKGYAPAPGAVISKPASYLALSFMLSRFIAESPFDKNDEKIQDLAASVPATDFVSSTEGDEIVKKGEDYFLFGKEKKWIRLSIKDE